MCDDARVPIRLEPASRDLNVAPGSALADVLFPEGVEFPCGARGRCRGCRVRVIQGSLPVTPEERRMLSQDKLDAGWRLACRHAADEPLTLEIAQWESLILADDARLDFAPREGSGIAIDVGTTTIVAQLVDLRTGRVLAVRSELNGQARHGADLMSRIGFAMSSDGSILTTTIRKQIGKMVAHVMTVAAKHTGLPPPNRVLLVGNTAMHHLFCGIDVTPLSHYPFEPLNREAVSFEARALGWETLPPTCSVCFLPCAGGFVGSDVVAGLAATEFHLREEPGLFLDLGTNGEIVVGDKNGMLCASTAAGPAFEGARIAMGMRAATGAISDVRVVDESWRCQVLGGGDARGICGSGLVSAIASGLELGIIKPNGRLANREPWKLTETVSLTQTDIRELQLAKGAIAAGARLITALRSESFDTIQNVLLAGAFGNYISLESARRTGLLRFPEERILPVGNAALHGAKRLLFADSPEAACEHICGNLKHISLHADPGFHETYVEEMGFPV